MFLLPNSDAALVRKVLDDRCHPGKAPRRALHELVQGRSEQIGASRGDTQQVAGFDRLGDHPLIAAERAALAVRRLGVAVLVHELATEGAHVRAGFFIKQPVNEAGGVGHDVTAHESPGVAESLRVFVIGRCQQQTRVLD